METINGKIKLTDLAHWLKITPSAVRQHLTNKSPLGAGAEKFGERQTGDYLLSIDSVLAFLDWITAKGRKVKIEDVEKTRNEINTIQA
jgi:hypothetical protein